MADDRWNQFMRNRGLTGANPARSSSVSARDLYNGYAQQVESEDDKWRKFMQNRSQPQIDTFSGRQEMMYADLNTQAEKARERIENSAAVLADLDKKKNGEIAPTNVQNAELRIGELDKSVQDMLNAYGNSYYDGSDEKLSQEDTRQKVAAGRSRGLYKPAVVENTYLKSTEEKKNPRGGQVLYSNRTIKNSDAQKAASDIMDATGWDIETLNKYISDAKTVGKFNYDKENGGTFLSPSEEIEYAQASIDSLPTDQRKVMNQITAAQRGQFKEDTSYMGASNRWLFERFVLGNKELGSNVTKIEDAKKQLKEQFGWDDKKIDNYVLMSKRLADYAETENAKKDFAISQDDTTGQKVAKSTLNTAWNLINAPTEGVLGAMSSLEKKPEGFGRNTYTYMNLPQNTTEEAQRQVVENAITDKHPVGQFAYNTGLSVGESAEIALLGGALGAGGSGASAMLARGASLVPFATSAYNSGYNEARERGASDKDAQLYGIAAGAAEAGTEVISLDHLWGMAKGTKVGKNLVINWLAQAGIEASEEAASDIANRVSDYYIMGDDGKNAQTIAIEKYMEQGMTEAEAKEAAEKDFWKQVGMDALAGGISGGVMGAGGIAVGVSNANANKARSNTIQDTFNNMHTEGDTAFDNAANEQAAQYAKNPTQFLADQMDDSTVEGKEAKANVQQYADKEASGKRLSISDRNDIEQSLWVAENAAQNNEASMDARSKYNQYVKEMTQVPSEYRTVSTSITEETAADRLAKAAKNGDVVSMGEVYQDMKNAKSAEVRNNADQIYERYYGMAESHGVTEQQLEAFKTSQQDAYAAGMRGENRGDMGALSKKAAEAYYAGQEARAKAQSQSVVDNSIKSANVTTKGGESVVLAGTFTDNGNVLTQDGKTVSVSDLKIEDRATQKAYAYADTQPSVTAKNAYMEGLKEGTNLEKYNIAWNSYFRAGRSGVDFDTQLKSRQAYADDLGTDVVRAMYDAGVEQSSMEAKAAAQEGLNKAFNVQKGAGIFEDTRANKADDNINTEALRMIAGVSGLNVRLVDDSSLDKNVNAYFDPKTSTVVVGSGATAQAFHEVLGEFTKFYNSSDYEALRSAAMTESKRTLGDKGFNDVMNAYAAAYGRAGQTNTDLEMSDEMTNDYAVAALATDKGRQAFAKYLAENYSQKQATSVKNRVANLFKSIARSIRNMISRSTMNHYQKDMLQKGAERLENDAEKFVQAFDKAIQNYRATEDGAKLNGDVAYSLKVDENGKELTVEQQDFFSESKIRNKDGALKVMHHGSSAYGFNVFDIKKAKAAGAYGRGFYFSDSDSHAGQYGKTYDVYLNIVNPLSTDTHDITKKQLRAFINEIANDEDYGIENYGYEATPASVANDVWGKDDFAMIQDINATCIGDFAEAVKIFNRVNGTNYDGIVAPTETVAFYSSQIKDIQNQKPTTDPDIRFSVKVDQNTYDDMTKNIPESKNLEGGKNVEQTKNLIAVHNLTIDQLLADIELGGLPSPSIAIIKAGMEHSKYGNVSLMFTKATINPATNRQNKVYGGDAWTPTFPRVDYKVNEKVRRKIEKRVNTLLPSTNRSQLDYFSMDEDNISDKLQSNAGNPVEAYKDSVSLKYAFLKEQGVDVKAEQREKRLNTMFTNEEVIAVANAVSKEDLEAFDKGSYTMFKEHPEVIEAMRKALNDNFREKYAAKDKRLKGVMDKDLYEELSFSKADPLIRSALQYLDNGIETEADPTSLRQVVKDNTDQSTYEEWLSELFDGIVEKKGLRNDKDLFTYSGNRRSFEVLHDDVTLDNIVKIMNKGYAKGGDAFFAQSAIQAMATKDFKSIDEIHQNEGMLRMMSDEEHNALTEDHSNRFSEIAHKIMDRSESNQFIAFDHVADAIADAIRSRKTAAGIENVLREYRQLNLYEGVGQDILDLMKDIAEMPTGYFEAKPRRAVYLNEIALAVIPDDVPQSALAALERKHIPYELYEAGNEDARTEILGRLDDNRRFSIDVDKYSYDSMKQHEDIELHSYEDFGLKGMEYSADLKNGDIARMARENIKRYNERKGNSLGSTALYNRELGANVLVGSDSLRHDKRRGKVTQSQTDARVALPLYFENAVIFNEADGRRNGADKSYIMFGAYNEGGETRIARVIVNHYDNGYTADDFDDVLYSMTQKEGAAAHMAAPIEDKSSHGTPSKLTITQLMYAVKENYPNELSLDVSRHLEYTRGKSDIDGLRYALDIDDEFFDIFGGGNNDYTAGSSILEEGMEALKHKDVDTGKIRSIAYRLRKEFGSTINVNSFSDNLQKVFAYMQTEDHVNYDDMMRVMQEVATPVIDAATTTTGSEEYKSFVDSLKGKKIKLTDVQKQEVISTFGSYGEFRRAVMPLTISDNGTTNLEADWQELVEASGFVLDADATEGDMPGMLYDTLSALRPSPVNNYGADRDGVSRDLAMRIVEEYLNEQGDSKSKALAAKMRKQNTQYRANLRERYEKRLKEAKADLRERYGNRAQDIRNRNAEKIAEIRAKSRDAAKDARQKRLANHEKQMISKRANDLIKWVSEPSEDHHIPRDMVEPVTEFLYAMDFVEPEVKQNDKGQYYVRVYNHSVIGADGSRSHVFDTLTGSTRQEVLQKFHEAIEGGTGSRAQRTWTDKMQLMKDLLNQVKSGDQFEHRSMDDFLQTIDPSLADEFDQMLKDNKGVANINQLGYADLHTINKTLRGVIHAINQGNKAFTQKATIADWADGTMNLAKNVKSPKDHSRFVEKLSKTLRLDMATPSTYFTLNGADGVYKSLRQAFNTKVADIRSAQEYMQQTMKGISKKEIKKWTGNEYGEFRVNGGTMRITTAQIMSLYELSKRGQAMLHQPGGFKVAAFKSGSKNVRQDIAMHLTDTDIAAIVGTLTPEQKRVADSMQKYMATECAKQGNEAAMLMYGYEKFTEKNYFPISTDKTMVSTNNSNLTNETLNSIERSGFTKQLKNNASNPIMIRDIFDVFTDHVSDMATYHGYAPAIKDANRWFNFRTTEDAGEFQKWASVKEAINKLSGDRGSDYFTTLIRDINGSEKSQDVGNVFDFLAPNYKAAAVGANVRVIIQQPTAYFRAMDLIDPKYLLSVSPKAALQAGRKMREQSEICWWKSQGYYETSIGKSMKEIITGQSGVMENIKNASMAGAGIADDLTWGVLYGAVTNEQKALAKGQNISQAELDQRIKDRFDEVVDRTQVVDSTLHRSQYMRSKGQFTKMQTAFMAEPTKSYNMLMQAIIEDYRDGAFSPKHPHPARTARAGLTFAFTAFVTSAAAALVDGVRKRKDDEEWGEVYKDALLGNILDNVNPLNMIPVVKDFSTYFVNTAQGNTFFNSSTRMDMDAITSLIDLGAGVLKALNGENNKTPYGWLLAFERPLSQVTGLPAYNLTRDLVSVYNQFFPDLEKTVANNKYANVYKAINRGRGQEEAIRKAIENGGVIKDIQSGITSKYKSDYYELLQTDPEQAEELAKKARDGFIATGMSEVEAESEIQKWETETVTYKELDNAIETGEGIQEAMQKVTESKDSDKIIEHIVNKYGSTIEYQNENNTDRNLEGNADAALGQIESGYDYNQAKEDLAKKAAETAAKQELAEKRNGHKQKIYDAVDSGSGNWQQAVEDLARSGMNYSDIKSAITEQYKNNFVTDYYSGKDVSKTAARIATIKAYCDEMQPPKNVSKSYGGDYYSYEYDKLMKWLEGEE